jgi:adenylate cyclase
MDIPPITRRLAAILAADVAGYSCLMAADEEATLRTLDAYRRTISEISSLSMRDAFLDPPETV